MIAKACLLLPLALTASDASTSPIKHIIVLMEENRSFDHFLGHLKAIDPRVNGLDSTSGNPLNPLDPHSQFIPVNYDPVDGGPIDPCHAFDCATQQIYGYEKPMSNKSVVPRMNGFAANTPGGVRNVPFVLSAFNQTTLPILSTLAQEFAVFDAWHSSAPTCTNPNREFMMSGTAHGMIDNTFPGPGFPQETLFNMIERRVNLTWKIYWGDNTWMAPAFADLRSPAHVSLVQQYENFFYDLGNGTLPAFTLIQPRTATGPGGISNWQHPDNSVEAGDAFIARVYTALKASQYWDNAALVITYDENGGCELPFPIPPTVFFFPPSLAPYLLPSMPFSPPHPFLPPPHKVYDHAPPPQEGVPPPDAVLGQNGFDYTRLGIRIPTVVVSPWIAKNTVVHAPTGAQAPTPTSQFDATSIISTSMKIFGINGSMSARDAWAGHFEDIFTGVNGQPRTDCPDLPVLPPISREVFDRESATPLNDHHLDTLDLLCGLTKGEAVTHPVCEAYPMKGKQAKFVQGLASEFKPALVALEENLDKVKAFSGVGAGVTWEHLHVPAVLLLRQMHFEAIHEALWTAYKVKVGAM